METLKNFFISLFRFETLGWALITNIIQLFIQAKFNQKTKTIEKKQNILHKLDYFLGGLPRKMGILDDLSYDFYKRSTMNIDLVIHDYDKIMNKSERDEFQRILRMRSVDTQITRCTQLLAGIRYNLYEDITK